MDKELPEGAITPLADPQQQRRAARRVLSGHQAQPCCELAPVLERGGISASSDQGRRGQGADAVELRKPLTGLMALKHALNRGVRLMNALIQGLEFR